MDSLISPGTKIASRVFFQAKLSSPVRACAPGTGSAYLTIKRQLGLQLLKRFPVNRWLKLVGVLLIGGIVVAVVSPDLDLPPTVVLVSQATQRPPVVAFAAISAATTNLWVQHFTYSPLAFLFRGSGNHPSADLIDLNCTRLC